MVPSRPVPVAPPSLSTTTTHSPWRTVTVDLHAPQHVVDQRRVLRPGRHQSPSTLAVQRQRHRRGHGHPAASASSSAATPARPSTPASRAPGTLVFTYPVAENDDDHDGISWPAGTVNLNGGTIKLAHEQDDADPHLRRPGRPQHAQKVDWSKPALDSDIADHPVRQTS